MKYNRVIIPLLFVLLLVPVSSFAQSEPDAPILGEVVNTFEFEDVIPKPPPVEISQTDDTIQVLTPDGKITFNKQSGASTLFDNDGIVIKSDSYIVRGSPLNTDNWFTLDVNDSPVIVTLDVSEEHLAIISATRTNDEGVFKVTTLVNDQGAKTTAYFTNEKYDNHKFAFTETLMFPDNLVKLNEQDIDLSLYAGQSFPREVLEANEDLVLQAKEVYFGAGLGFEHLWQVNIHNLSDNGYYPVSLDWANVGERHTPIGVTVELDPTVAWNTPNFNSASWARTSMTMDAHGHIVVCNGRDSGFYFFDATTGTSISTTTNVAWQCDSVAMNPATGDLLVGVGASVYIYSVSNSHAISNTGNFSSGANAGWCSETRDMAFAPISGELVMACRSGNSNGAVYHDGSNYNYLRNYSPYNYGSAWYGVTVDSTDRVFLSSSGFGFYRDANGSSGTWIAPSSTPYLAYDSVKDVVWAVRGETSSGESKAWTTTAPFTQVQYGHSSQGSPSQTYYYIKDIVAHDGFTYTINGGSSTPRASAVSWSWPTIPDTPTAPVAIFSTNQINTVTWSAPFDGNDPITNYELFRNGSSLGTLGNVLSYTDTGLTIGTSNYYSVIAINGIGSSVQSPNSNTILNANPPDAPQGFLAVTGSPITMSYLSPTSDMTVTNFKIYRDGSLYDTIGAVNSYTDSNTVSGNSYVYEVSAVSVAGEGVKSSSSTAIHGTPPSEPLNLTSVINNPNPSPLTISLDFDAPSNMGTAGSLSGYEIIRDGVTIDVIGTTSLYNDTVPNQGVFVYTIKSISAHGVSVASNQSSITTPTVPGTITDLLTTPISETQIGLNFSAPSNGGSNIVEYKIIRDGVEISTTPTPNYSDGTVLTQTSYTYEIITNNNVGDSASSNSSTALTFGVPDAPTLTVSQNNITSLDLSWGIPQDYNSPINGYKIEMDDGSGYTVLVPNTGSTDTTFTKIGLTPISEYFFRVSAINAYGTGDGGINSNWTNPTAPTGLIVIPDSTSTNLEIYWDANVSATGYKIERENGIGNGWNVVVSDTGNTNTAYQDTGLTDNVFYNYRLSTVTPVGNSLPSGTYSQTTFHLPDPVISITADDGLAGRIVLDWDAPATPYGSILGYTIYEVTAPGITATADATLSTTLDQLSAIYITNPGASYVTAPTVTISAPGGVAPFVTATATATITNGLVTGITITNNGDGYNTPPTVTLSPPAVNTLVVSSTVLTPVVADTLSATPTYSIPITDPANTYAFAVAPITVHGSTILGAAIVSISPEMIFEGLAVNIPNETNPIQNPILFAKTVTGNNTNVVLTYDSSLNITCETTTPFTSGKTTYPNLSETPIGNGKVTHTMTFQNSDNSIVDMMCYDQSDPTIKGQDRITQNVIPLKNQVDDFSNNVFGTGSTFAGLDLMTLVVVIVGMIGFNRRNPAVGLALMGGMLGILSILGIIQWQTTAIGGIVLMVFLGIIQGRKRR